MGRFVAKAVIWSNFAKVPTLRHHLLKSRLFTWQRLWPCLRDRFALVPLESGMRTSQLLAGGRSKPFAVRENRRRNGQILPHNAKRALPVSLFPQARRKPYTHTQESLCPKRKSVLWSCRRRVVLKQKNTSRAGAAEALDRADSFAAAFFGLKRVFAPHVKHLKVNTDTRSRFYLETKSPTFKGKPLFFGAVISGKAYVSFHLMPLYWDESLRKKVSPELKKRMQGLSCFNFSGPDPASFRELAKLTTAGLALYRRKNLL